MNILLIKPYYSYPYSRGDYTYNRIWPPLCLMNCAALLEKDGHNVKILDAHAFRIAPNKISNYIRGYNKIFITSSTLDRWQCPNINITSFIETSRRVKEAIDEIYIMGYHGTINPEEMLYLTQAKGVIRGEPEYTILEICRDKNLYNIKGLTFKDNGKIISNPPREPLNLTDLPTPAFHLLDFKKYFYEILGKNFSLFEASRGCNYKCRFCNKVMYGEKLRNKSIEQIITEIRTAIEKFNVKTGYFIDLDFLSNKELVDRICSFLIKEKYRFEWACQTRPRIFDQEILIKMKKAGCKLIHLGVETGSDSFLEYFNKGIKTYEIKKTVDLCKKIGIKTVGFYLFGLPQETDEYRANIFRFMKELNTEFISIHRIFSYNDFRIYRSNTRDNNKRYKVVDKSIQRLLLMYYLRPYYLSKLDLLTIWKGLIILLGRFLTLN